MRIKGLLLDYIEDCARIQQVLVTKARIQISAHDAQALWRHHSEKHAAGWLLLPESDQALLDEVLPYIDVEKP